MRTIAITGASGGLAQALVRRIPADDYLILLGRSKERLEDLYKQRKNCVCLALDIRDDYAIEQMVDYLYQEFGQIDVFINNAGFGDFKPFESYKSEEIREMFAVNTFATMAFSRLVGSRMAEAGQGHLINIASMAGLIATSKASVYSASKFAVIGFSNALRLELADKNVYVTTVNPGPVATKFFDFADPTGAYLKSVEKYTLPATAVAEKMVKSFGKNKRELNLPWLLALTYKLYVLFPRMSDFLARKVFNYK
ncbi:SDR family NAD(P)-dependent oxidoreductase [Streptococcus sp. H49]|uniref:SDR family NAD(P)-dependent oxidoreductase n=1 Tax=Streptococcus huangxiaojuni TaxID=3237239 RepID=UPI0034A542D0